MTSPLPDWCRVRRGGSNLVLVAPHGGRRPAIDPAEPRDRKVNDLYTAELTAELAATMDATALINHGLDRNAIDLNRIGQIRRRADWFLDLIVEEIGAVLGRHTAAQVLLVHGWNVVQAKCDLGVGARETPDGDLHAVGNAALSVGDKFWQTRVAPFRTACAAAGIATPVGERYPAAHPSNLLQAFTRRAAAATDPRLRQLAAWAEAGRLDAVQLELGIPLRWPGPVRRAFQAAVVTAFGAGASCAAAWSPEPPFSGSAPAALGFHFHDPHCGITAFTSLTPLGNSTAGRLLLFLGGQEIALFTGEDPGGRGAVGGLHYAADGGSYHLQFAGPASRLADAGLYLDLEAALAGSVLADVRLDLRYEPMHETSGHQPQPGHFNGTLSVDGERVVIAARGFLDAAVALRGPGSHGARTHLAATFDDGAAFSLRAPDGGRPLSGMLISDGASQTPPAGEVTMTCDGDVYTPRHFQLQLDGDGPAIAVRPLARMPIIRPLGPGSHARITFGPARFDWDGRVGWGVYEYARRVTAPAG